MRTSGKTSPTALKILLYVTQCLVKDIYFFRNPKVGFNFRLSMPPHRYGALIRIDYVKKGRVLRCHRLEFTRLLVTLRVSTADEVQER